MSLSSSTLVTTRQETIVASDGYPIVCTHFGQSEGAPLRVVVAGCIGARQSYYRHFAQRLAREGWCVSTFDYRGIGLSRRGPLRAFSANLTDWAENDLEAVVNRSLNQGKTAVVGHSFGGHAFGTLTRVNELEALYTFASGAGHHSYMNFMEGLKVRAMWSILGPVTTRPLGYLPSQKLGLGQDLPLGVYRQWKEWCSSPQYFFDRPDNDYRERFDRVGVPIRAITSVDDPWSPPRSVRAFVAGYRGVAPVIVDETSPDELGVKHIGHMGYFRPGKCERLWETAVQWLHQFAATRSHRTA